MYNFGAAVAWYYITMFVIWAFAAIEAKRNKQEINTNDVNLDIPVLAGVYLIYYYFDFL